MPPVPGIGSVHIHTYVYTPYLYVYCCTHTVLRIIIQCRGVRRRRSVERTLFYFSCAELVHIRGVRTRPSARAACDVTAAVGIAPVAPLLPRLSRHQFYTERGYESYPQSTFRASPAPNRHTVVHITDRCSCVVIFRRAHTHTSTRKIIFVHSFVVRPIFRRTTQNPLFASSGNRRRPWRVNVVRRVTELLLPGRHSWTRYCCIPFWKRGYRGIRRKRASNAHTPIVGWHIHTHTHARTHTSRRCRFITTPTASVDWVRRPTPPKVPSRPPT